MSTSPPPSGGMTHFIGKIIVRVLQFLLGITVVGLYSVHLDDQRKKGKPYNTNFMYAVIIGALSALTAVVYAIPFVKWRVLWIWDSLLTLNWIIVFGIFGKLFLQRPDGPKYSFEGTHTRRMRNAAWLDLANVVLWLLTATYGAVVFFKARKATKSVYAEGSYV